MDHEGRPSPGSVALLELGMELLAECERLAGRSRRAEADFRVWEGLMEEQRLVRLGERAAAGESGRPRFSEVSG